MIGKCLRLANIDRLSPHLHIETNTSFKRHKEDQVLQVTVIRGKSQKEKFTAKVCLKVKMPGTSAFLHPQGNSGQVT